MLLHVGPCENDAHEQSIMVGVLDNREGSFSLFRVPHRCLPRRSVRVEEIQRSPFCAINALFAQSIPPIYLLPLTRSYSPLYRVNQLNGEGWRNEGWLKQERQRAQERSYVYIYICMYIIYVYARPTNQSVIQPTKRLLSIGPYRAVCSNMRSSFRRQAVQKSFVRKKNQREKMKHCT